MKRPIIAFLALVTIASTAASDGFHSPLLRNKDPRRWAKTVREKLGLDSSDSAEGGPAAAGFAPTRKAGLASVPTVGG